jgi:hypothetical protein
MLVYMVLVSNKWKCQMHNIFSTIDIKKLAHGKDIIN